MMPGEKKLYTYLVELARDNKHCPTNDDIAEAVGLNVKTIFDYMAKLTKSGMIKSRLANNPTRRKFRVISIVALGIDTAEPPAKKKKKVANIFVKAKPKREENPHSGELGGAIDFLKKENYRPVVAMKYTERGGRKDRYQVGNRYDLTADEVINMADTIKERRAARRAGHASL